MLIETCYDGVEIHREDRIIYARFLLPHQVLSTCRAAGGMRDDLEYVYNHQSCEPSGHHHGVAMKLAREPERYRKLICDRHALPHDVCATLGTAANMHNACIETSTFRDLSVVVVCTGGVEGNAGRAGDPASMFETPDGFEKLSASAEVPPAGTINMMLFINKPLIPGAMTRVIVTATEAKSAALQELAVNSLYSDGLATGTGTDQIAVCAAQTGEAPLTSAGKHAKLGELIGRAVHGAVKGTLALQNGLTPAGQCSAVTHLRRFGMDRDGIQDAICSFLTPEQAGLLRHSFMPIERDPTTVAAVAAMAHLRDKFSWGVLPAGCWKEIMGSAAAQLSCAVSGNHGRMQTYMRLLGNSAEVSTNGDFLMLACRALALGFEEKWHEKERTDD